jgi:hypothetical protein
MNVLEAAQMTHGLVLTEFGCELFSRNALGMDDAGMPKNLTACAQFVLLTEDEARLFSEGKAVVSTDAGEAVELATHLAEDGFIFRAPSLKTMKVSTSCFDEVFNN